jgi:nicotinate dehydrogenase subunit B
MLHGRVVRPPEVGATVGSVDETSIRDLPGIVKVVVKANFVGVVAQKPWQAMQGAERLKVNWTGGTPLSPHADLYSAIRKQPARDTLLVDSGDVDARLAAASTVLRSTYRARSPTFAVTRPRCGRQRSRHFRRAIRRPCCSASSRRAFV